MRKIQIYLLIISLFIITTENIYSQKECKVNKTKLIKEIFNKEQWMKNIQVFLSQSESELANYEQKEFDILYANIVDSACSFFSKDELKKIKKKYHQKKAGNNIQYAIIKNMSSYKNFDPDKFIKHLLKVKDTADILVGRIIDFTIIASETGKLWAGDLVIRDLGYEPNQGVRDYYLNNYEKSLEYFNKKILSISGGSYQDYLFQGFNFQALAKFDIAVQSFKKAQNESKNKAEVDYALADLYFYDKFDEDNALIEIKNALKKEPENYYYNLFLAKIYNHTEAFDKAIELCNKLVEIKPDEIDAYNTRARGYIKKKEFTKAEKDFRLLLKMDSTNIKGLLGIGEIYFLKQELDSSYFYAKKSYHQSPDDFFTINLLGDIYMQKGEYELAELLLEKALKKNENSIYLNNLGYCKMQLGKYGESIVVFKEVIKNYQIDELNEMPVAFTYNNLGFCYYKTGKLDLAEKNIKISLDIFPENACAIVNKGLVFIEKGETEKACVEFLKAKEMELIGICDFDINELIENNCNNQGD